MSNTETQLAPLIITFLAACIPALLSYIISRRKTQADAASTLTQVAVKMVEPLEKRVNDLMTDLKCMTERAENAEQRTRMLESEVTRLRIMLEEYKQEIKYKVLFYMINDPIVMIAVPTWKILDANFAAASVFGWTREELGNMNYTDLVDDKKAMVSVLDSRRDKVNGVTYIRKDGTKFNASIIMSHFSQFDGRYCIAITEVQEN